MTPKKRHTIVSAILIGYALILAAVAGLGWFFSHTLGRMQAITVDLYVHPFAVSNAAADLKGNLFQLRNHMLQTVLLNPHQDDIEQKARDAALFRQAATDNLDVIKANFLGDMTQVHLLESRLQAWDSVRDQIIDAVRAHDLAQATLLVRTQGSPKFAELVPAVDYIREFAKSKGRFFADQAQEHADVLIKQAYLFAAGLMLFVLLTAILVIWRVHFLHNELDRQATTDFLTGVPNRRHFVDLAQRELARAGRYGGSFSLAVADIDLFKHINDAHGHAAGDEALKQFCDLCLGSLRDTDLLGRLGGEEFGMLLPNTGLADAMEVVERVRRTIESSDIVCGAVSQPLRMTASFGLVVREASDHDVGILLRRADVALYRAKSTGRNRVCA